MLSPWPVTGHDVPSSRPPRHCHGLGSASRIVLLDTPSPPSLRSPCEYRRRPVPFYPAHLTVISAFGIGIQDSFWPGCRVPGSASRLRGRVLHRTLSTAQGALLAAALIASGVGYLLGARATGTRVNPVAARGGPSGAAVGHASAGLPRPGSR